EVEVNAAFGCFGFGGNLVHQRAVVALGRKYLDRRVEDALVTLLAAELLCGHDACPKKPTDSSVGFTKTVYQSDANEQALPTLWRAWRAAWSSPRACALLSSCRPYWTVPWMRGGLAFS